MSLSLYWHTLKYLRPFQLFGQLRVRFRRPLIDCRLAPKRREREGRWVLPTARPPKMMGPIRFRFLNKEHKLQSSGTWNDPAIEKLWLYNLHYFDDLNASQADRRIQWHEVLIKCWIRENPYPHGNGWESFPCSLRIVNWIKWAMRGHTLTPDMLQSLASQIRHLARNLETHLLGNHLFSNAKALCFAGLFFQGVEPTSWLRTGYEILAQQIEEQILRDGGHMERSPMYHALILEDLLDLLNLMKAFNEEEYFIWHEQIEGMRRWLLTMCHPDGEIALFNDAALEIAPSLQELEEYAQRLELAPLSLAKDESLDLTASGYTRLVCGRAVALLDLAPLGPDYLPAHGHADTLTFELSLNGNRLIVDSGTSCYGLSEERLRQRGSSAHNTLVLDGQNSSVVWAGFRVAQRARVSERMIFFSPYQGATAAHDGYCRLKGGGIHRRSFSLDENGLKIDDRMEGTGHHQILFPLHLHPEILIRANGKNNFLLMDSSKTPLARLLFSPEGVACEEPSTYHPQFGITINSSRIVFYWEGSLPIQFSTCITWDTSSVEPLSSPAEDSSE